jgi:hypothetical protein
VSPAAASVNDSADAIVKVSEYAAVGAVDPALADATAIAQDLACVRALATAFDTVVVRGLASDIISATAYAGAVARARAVAAAPVPLDADARADAVDLGPACVSATVQHVLTLDALAYVGADGSAFAPAFVHAVANQP